MGLQESELTSRLQHALEWALEAQGLIMGYYQNADLKVEDKKDSSPVTLADRGAEELLRKHIESIYPQDGILGEEYGEKAGSNGFRWVLDPVDGTKSFVHGVPLFGTLIGIEFESKCVVGVCRFPALNEVMYARKGGGAWWQKGEQAPTPAKCSNISKLEDACFCTTNAARWVHHGHSDVYKHLCETVKLSRGWGDCFGHMLVATGRAELMVDPILSPWDAAALVPILEEAGGHFLDYQGNATIYSSHGFSVNGALKDTALKLFRK
jgi:histidinol phosphatase-like enzyme (inositol monophosphatase family)